jgi:hypothetical protein
MHEVVNSEDVQLGAIPPLSTRVPQHVSEPQRLASESAPVAPTQSTGYSDGPQEDEHSDCWAIEFTQQCWPAAQKKRPPSAYRHSRPRGCDSCAESGKGAVSGLSLGTPITSAIETVDIVPSISSALASSVARVASAPPTTSGEPMGASITSNDSSPSLLPDPSRPEGSRLIDGPESHSPVQLPYSLRPLISAHAAMAATLRMVAANALRRMHAECRARQRSIDGLIELLVGSVDCSERLHRASSRRSVWACSTPAYRRVDVVDAGVVARDGRARFADALALRVDAGAHRRKGWARERETGTHYAHR